MYCTFDKKPVYYYGGHLIEKGHLIKWWASNRNGGLLIEISELLLGVGHGWHLIEIVESTAALSIDNIHVVDCMYTCVCFGPGVAPRKTQT